MSNDFFFAFSDKTNIENESLKINLDELFIKKQEQDLNVLNNYNKILVRIHNKIKYISKQTINDNCCWYIIPEFVLGLSKYNHKDCCVYVIEKLRINGFVVRYTHPNLLFISWKHWIPLYVRNEIKKKTGNNIDEYGNIINKEEISTKNNNNINDNLNIYNNINKINKNNNEKKDYKDIRSYKPSGNLVYNNNLLDKLKL